MTLIKPNARRLVIFYFLLLCIFASSSACYSAAQENNNKTLNGKRNAQVAENGSENIMPADKTETAKTAASADAVEGWYQFKNYRAGKGGALNLLIIKKLKNGNLSVSFEGTYAYQANGAETFHESEAAGEFNLKGSVWRGNLSEEAGDQTGCLAALTFSAGKVTLKSPECRLNVSPDGIYKNIPPQEEGETSQTSDENSAENAVEVEKSNADQSPRIEYEGKTPAAIVNLMAHDGEREGCAADVLGFYGKVLKVNSEGDYDFEITLADDNGKRQKFSLILVAEDKLPFTETRRIIKIGNYLEITYLNCGNAPIASPTEIYLR